jgi:exodeoxyribonuclease III
MEKNLKIYSWNVNGIRAVTRHGLIDWIEEEKPDVLCIQELKAQEKDIPKEVVKIDGYYKYFNSAKKKGYSGTAILTKIKPVGAINYIGIPEFDDEGRFLLLEFENFYLLNVYFPNTQRELKRLAYKQEFNNAYLKFVKKFKDKPIILTGDFNVAHNEIDLKNPKQNTRNAGFTIEERVFVDQLIKANFVDTFRHFYPEKKKYTWWSYRFGARDRNIGWRIDYFFVPKSFIKKVKKSEILDRVYGSDHCPVMIEI